MPSNADLQKEIEVLAAELGITLETPDKKPTNKELSALLSDLKAKKRDGELTTGADAEVEPAPEPEVKSEPAPESEPEVKKGPVVAEGKSLTTRKGILVEGDKVLPEYLAGGEKTFNILKEKGYIKA
jgi:hypothetical protein